MNEEYILTGYCRTQDQSRMVTVEVEKGEIFVDCSYGNCPYEKNCSIAKAVAEKE